MFLLKNVSFILKIKAFYNVRGGKGVSVKCSMNAAQLTDLKEQVYCLLFFFFLKCIILRDRATCVLGKVLRDFSYKTNTHTRQTHTNTKRTTGVSPVTLTHDYPCMQQTKSLRNQWWKKPMLSALRNIWSNSM